MKQAEITYLDNSGFAVKTAGHVLIFDDWLMKPVKGKSGLAGGAVDPRELADKDVLVFVSHGHGDHFNPAILKWKKEIKNIRYILSDDIRPAEGALMAAPGKEYQIGGADIRTYRSTDEGVAFLVRVDGLTIYHAGDLNWWHWEGEDPGWNAQMAHDYRAEIEKLRGKQVDIAFVPVDPRLGKSCLKGIRLFMDVVGAKMAIPMHYREAGKYAADALETLPPELLERIVPPMERGQTVVFKAE